MRTGLKTIIPRLVNACWYCFKLVVGAALVGAAAIGVYMYVRMDDEVRRHIEAMLAERYPQLDVSVGGARVVEGKGIAVYDLSLADPTAAGRRGQLLLVDELMLVCDVELTALVRGAPEVRRVEVKHPQAFLERGPNGRWNLAALAPTHPYGGACPQIVVRDGVLSIGDPASGAPPLALRDVHLTIGATGSPAHAGDWPSLHVDGTAGGPLLRKAEIHAALDGAQRRCTATIGIDRLQLSEQLLAWVRPYLPPAVRSTSVTGQVDGKLTLDWAVNGPPQAKGTFTLHDGRLADSWLPQPVTELTGRVVVDGATLEVKEMTGKCGAATVAASLNRNGWSAAAPIGLSARADNVPLDDSLYQALATASRDPIRPAGMPHILREQWDRYRPAGVVDATLQASFDGGKWRSRAELTGRRLSFESDKFAYRLTDGSGKIIFAPADEQSPALLTIDVVGHGGGQPLKIVGQVVNPRPLAAGWAEITGSDVEIEKRMIEALEPKPREVIASLNPSGKMNVYWRIDRPAPGEPTRTTMQLDLADVRINYNKFPYPVRHIRGKLTAVGNEWTFRDLVSAGRPTIRGEGYLRPIGEGCEFSLRITAEQAPMNEDLFDALPAPVQQAWQQLQPRGEIDLTADVFYRTGQMAPNISAAIRPRPESAQLRPAFFPYLMEQVSGTIGYQDGEISLAEVRAEHDRTTIRTNGNGYFAPDGQWKLRLVGLTADRLTPAQDLLSALPKPLGKLIERLQPTGTFSLSNGVLEFRQSASAIAAMESEWDVQLDCHQADLRCGIDLQNIHGSVRLAGRSDGERSSSSGELALETVTFQNVQFTGVRGPLLVDQSRCLLGRWATDQQQQAARHLTGFAYGGGVSADGWVTFDNLPQYRAEATLVGADLNRLLVERSGGQHNLGGKVDADLRLNGNGYKVESLVGDGHIHVRDANIGELPLLASLLKVMRTGSSNKTAFEKCEVAFKLQGRHIYLDQVDFLGDAVNLYGKGDTNFDQQLNLVFSPSVARNDSYFPLVKTLVGQANQQIMQMYVTGTMSQPEVTREAFPKINQMLQQVRQDLEDPVGAAERQAQRGIEIGVPARQ